MYAARPAREKALQGLFLSTFPDISHSCPRQAVSPCTDVRKPGARIEDIFAFPTGAFFSLLYSRLGEEAGEGPLRHSANKVYGDISARTSPSIQARNRCFVRAPSSKINIAGSLVGEEGRGGGETLGSPGTTFALMSCSARQKQPHTCCKVRHARNSKRKGEIGFSPFALLPFPSFQPKYGISFVRSRNRTGGTSAAAHKSLLFFRRGREDERRYGAVKKGGREREPGESAFDILKPPGLMPRLLPFHAIRYFLRTRKGSIH